MVRHFLQLVLVGLIVLFGLNGNRIGVWILEFWTLFDWIDMITLFLLFTHIYILGYFTMSFDGPSAQVTRCISC